MNNWKRTSLGNFISLQRGYDLTSEERKPGSIPVFGAAGHNGFHNEIKVKGPGIVVGRSGGSFGQAHFVKEDFWPHNTAMFVSDFKGNNVLFTFYLLKSLDFSNLNSGSAQPSLNRNYLYDFPVFVPSVEDQQKIASILSAIDDKIELNNKINAELEGMAKLMYDYWFVQFDFPFDFAQNKPADETSDPKDVKPYKSSGGKMVWNKELKREVPEGWGIKRLGDLGVFKNGVNYDPSNPGEIACPIINVRNISASSFFIQNEDLDIIFLRESDVRKYSVNGGNIIIARSGIPGATRLISDISENTLFCGFAIQYSLNDLEFKIPIFFFLKSLEEHIQSGSGGTILKNVNQGTLSALKIALPKEDSIVEKFNNLIDPIFEKITNVQKQSQYLTALRDWLLPMLMNGQVRVD